jgi:hypothetical protein
MIGALHRIRRKLTPVQVLLRLAAGPRQRFQGPWLPGQPRRELARRGEALGTSEPKQLLEYAIEQGRGGLYLNLTPDQYRKLRS